MIREMPLERLLSKAFLRPWQLSECHAAQLILAGHTGLGGTRFAHLRLGLLTWESPHCGELPKGLDAPLQYWVTPWQSKFRRPLSVVQRVERRLRFRRTVSDFRKLVRVMDWKGWVGPAVPGILLVGGGWKEVAGPRQGDPDLVPESAGREIPFNRDSSSELFLHTDGNRRIGIAAAVGILRVPVKITPLLTFDWQGTRAAGTGRFSEGDTRRIWEHVWERVLPDYRRSAP